MQALLGSIYYRCGATPAAVEHLSLAVRLDLDKPEYHIARGIALDHLGKHDDALADFNTAIALDPTASLAYYERGVSQKYRKGYGAVLEDFRRSIAFNDTDHQAYVGAAEALAHQGKWRDALDYATRAAQPGSTTVAVLIKELQQRLDAAELKRDSDPSRHATGTHQLRVGSSLSPRRRLSHLLPRKEHGRTRTANAGAISADTIMANARSRALDAARGRGPQRRIHPPPHNVELRAVPSMGK